MRRYVFPLVLLLVFLAGCALFKKEKSILEERNISKVKEYLRSYPRDYKGYFQLGQLLFKRGAYQQAVTYLDSALVLKPGQPGLIFWKARAQYAAGERRAAYENFLRVLQSDEGYLFAKRIGGIIGVLYRISKLTEGETHNAFPAYFHSGQKIAFQSWRNGNWDIYVMNPEGGEQELLVGSPDDEENPTLSPDDRYLYYTRVQPGAADGKRDIYRLQLASRKEEGIISSPADDWYPVLSPDGRYLFFCSDRQGRESGPLKKATSAIFRWDLEKGELKHVVGGTESYMAPYPHPLERYLICLTYQNDVYRLVQLDFNGKNIRPLFGDPFHYGSPKFSPDGRKIAFFSNREGNFDIYLRDLETGELLRLTGHPSHDMSPDFSPDGQRLVFHSNRDGHYQIYAIEMDQMVSQAELIDQLRNLLRSGV